MNKLADYLQDKKLTQREFASTVGVKQATISRIVSGQIIPSLDLAVKIERVTDGRVRATGWIPEVAASCNAIDHEPGAATP